MQRSLIEWWKNAIFGGMFSRQIKPVSFVGDMRSVLVGILLSLIGLLVACVALEVVVRLSHLDKPAMPSWNTRPPFYFRAEGAATLQDYPHEATKPKSTFRIAVIGDSYTFAPYMQFTDTFPKVLERMLNLNKSALKAEVINYGVPAYSTSHEVAVAEQAVKEQADLVILQITLNDAELKPYTPTGIQEGMPDRFGALKFGPAMTTITSYWHTLDFVLKRIHNTRTHAAYRDYFIELFDNPRGWKVFTQSLTKIRDTCIERKTPLIAVVLPLFGSTIDENYPFRELHAKIGGLLDQLQITHEDIVDAYQGIPTEVIQVIPGVDRHPNEIGHRIAAEQIYLALEKHQLLPEELKIRERFKTRLGTVKQEPYR